MNLKAYGDKVIILPDPVETKTESGLYLPDRDTTLDKQTVGRIVAKGSQVPAEYKIGDRVIYSRYHTDTAYTRWPLWGYTRFDPNPGRTLCVCECVRD